MRCVQFKAAFFEEAFRSSARVWRVGTGARVGPLTIIATILLAIVGVALLVPLILVATILVALRLAWLRIRRAFADPRGDASGRENVRVLRRE
jgi:hypothetical protein